MFSPHPVFEQPLDTAISIWRYMNLSALVWMLQRKSLYFCRCDLLGDPYEGYYTLPFAQSEDAFVAMMLSNADFAKLPNAKETATKAFRDMLELPKRIRKDLYVSCWHMNEEESLAMWKLYTSQDDSICIRSTYSKLADVLPSDCFLGRVKYIDYRRDQVGDAPNLLTYIVHKRKSFEHEREIRAVHWVPFAGAPTPFERIKDEGLIVPVNLNRLIDEIYVSPNSKPMLHEIVDGLARTYGINARVRQSEVNDPPSY